MFALLLRIAFTLVLAVFGLLFLTTALLADLATSRARTVSVDDRKSTWRGNRVEPVVVEVGEPLRRVS